MSNFTSTRKREEHGFAAFMLYAASAIGLVNLFFSASVIGTRTPLISLDIVAYIFLFLVAFLIHRGIKFAKILYIIAAVFWYGLLIFYLPEKYGHMLNLFVVFVQLVITVLAFVILFSRPVAKIEES